MASQVLAGLCFILCLFVLPQPTRGAVHTMTPTVCRRGHKRLIGTVAASTPNDRRVIPDLTPSGASVLVVSFLHGIFPRRTGHGRRRTTSILHTNLWRFRGIVRGRLRDLRPLDAGYSVA